MITSQKLLKKYAHTPDEFPVLMRQTHKIIKDSNVVSERININENLIHYVQDTALLISMIDGSVTRKTGEQFEHVIYLDKSARPVSWLVNLFWNDLALKQADGTIAKRPPHSYLNIDRAPWFRNVGINVSDDGRQKENGELASYTDFVQNISNLTEHHLAQIRALFIDGGIEDENISAIMKSPTVLDGKRVLIVDEVSRTGSTLKIAEHLFRSAFPTAKEIRGTYFWHPSEPLLKVGNETMLTSLPVWYDPNTMTGRGIGGLKPEYYRKRYEYYLERKEQIPGADLKKLRTQAFSADVFSAPLLYEDGTVMPLQEEKVTRLLCDDLLRLRKEYRMGRIFFLPPAQWRRTQRERYMKALQEQGVKMLPIGKTAKEQEELRKDPLFFLNFVEMLKSM